MAAPKNFVTGFNHNVRHNGQGYHVQTEDSGDEIAHVITHLFQGGNILATKKSSYAELRGEPDLKARVRALMEEQHKKMLRELIAGAFDSLVAPSSPAPAAPPVSAQSPGPRSSPPAFAQSPGPRSAPPSFSKTPGPLGAQPVFAQSPGPPLAHSGANSRPSSPWGRVPLWPTALEAAAMERGSPTAGSSPKPTPTFPAPPARASTPPVAPPVLTPAAKAAPATPFPIRGFPGGKLPEPTPGPGVWRNELPAETIHVDDLASEKSLDQAILRYLAGERDE
ncbi:hypothetical protein [Vulgatibacter incomptus]|uniref:Uncharacterized protein n=1 Tax=Vulgatibacter incomptus TaxID=1391653 RepID=A0A0K1PA11_9BACT|nr:hypothetical protein [Vulgatibacter incomptus]AKU90342.1 hypothetical protein AKJ08_0729 [Vulgatibacter incomptus]